MKWFRILTLIGLLVVPTTLLFGQQSGEFDLGDERQGMKEVPLETEEAEESQDASRTDSAQGAESEAVSDSEDDDEGGGDFIPSEKINVDSEISFPVDI